MSLIEQKLLHIIAGLTGRPEGAFSLRRDGKGVERFSTENITILPKADKPGVDVYVKPGAKGESVHIPVILTQSGMEETVYNEFQIGEGAEVTIIAGCGIHNDGHAKSEHDGVHTFFIGKNAHVRYVENHYGEGDGSGQRVLNPKTNVHLAEGASCEMETSQIGGVDSTKRETTASLAAGAHLVMSEKLLTHGKQQAVSDVTVQLNGEGASLRLVSRSVARDGSVQVFHPVAVGNAPCRAHVQCDSLIMDKAQVSSIPEIRANHSQAQIVHEAAIGRINSDQLLKLQTFGLDEAEAEAVIVDCFLK